MGTFLYFLTFLRAWTVKQKIDAKNECHILRLKTEIVDFE